MSHFKKSAAKFALISAMVRMLDAMRDENGDHIDGIACDLSMTDEGDFHGNLASLVGDIEMHGESL